MTDNVNMQVTNHTTIKDSTIQAMLTVLGITNSKDFNLTLEIGDLSGRGVCTRRGQTLTVILRDPCLLTLAHELKHVEQHVSGLSDWMKAERELTPYKDRWHEIEARDFAQSILNLI